MRSNSVISERAAYQGRELHFSARFVVTSTDDKLLIKISVFVLIACISNCRKKPQHQNADFLVYLIQWNPDFSNPRFHEPPDISNQTLFPLDLLHSGSIISPPISRTLDFPKLPITRTNFGSRGTN